MNLRKLFNNPRHEVKVMLGIVIEDGPGSTQANALKMSLDRYIDWKQHEANGRMFITEGSQRNEKREMTHAVTLKIGGYLFGSSIVGAHIGKEIVIGRCDDEREHMIREQVFALNDLDRAMDALKAIAEREIAVKKHLKIQPARTAEI